MDTAGRTGVVAGDLPQGATLRLLSPNPDDRGVYTEIYRDSWEAGQRPIQWSACASEPGVLRGVRVHFDHDDWLVVLSGRATVGLRDLRPASPTEGRTALVALAAVAPGALAVPAGVAHGLYFHEPSVFVVGVSAYHDDGDETSIRWDDPSLGISWPFEAPRLSPHDAAGAPLAEVLARPEFRFFSASGARGVAGEA